MTTDSTRWIADAAELVPIAVLLLVAVGLAVRAGPWLGGRRGALGRSGGGRV